MSIQSGCLYVVATPIGNREDISRRALTVLAGVQRIAAEDTRHSKPLLQHYGIKTPIFALHEHNEAGLVPELVANLQAGDSLALISDAGTPLISDPGFRLVRAAAAAGVTVIPIPGASALTTALSGAGLPTDHFFFEGFLPAKSMARRARLEQLQHNPHTLVVYESSHRIQESLADMVQVLGGERQAVIARELTKLFETFLRGSLQELVQRLAEDAKQCKGEFVVLIQGAQTDQDTAEVEADRVLKILLKELPVKQAATLAAEITGARRNRLYRRALEMNQH